jgi:hypothetical protein
VDLDAHSHALHSRFGKLRIGIVIVFGSFWILAPNMPSSGVRNQLDSFWRPAEEIGLVQDWGVFSPNPRSQSLDVRAHLEYDDGTTKIWDVPEFDAGFGAYRAYRWHKWQERIRLDNREIHWEPTAAWIAERNDRDGVEPARIILIRRWIDHEPLRPDGQPINNGWNEFEFYTWERDS